MTDSITSKDTVIITTKGTFGLWFLFHQIGMNLNPMLLSDLITETHELMRNNTFRYAEAKVHKCEL